MVRTKVCGITREADLEAAVAAGTDAVGVIAEVPVDSPREVSVDRASRLVAATPPTVSTVLVTMAPTTGRVTELAAAIEPDAVQVHGEFSPQRVVRLGAELPTDVIAVADAADPAQARRYDGVADAVLVDSVSAEGGGGTGRTHDWDRTAEVVAELSSPVILAGGLTPENVARAVRTVDPFGVDVASGVEREGGIKDHGAVREYVANAREAGADRSSSAARDGRGREVEP